MKKYAVHGVVEVEVVKQVWANSEDEAYEKASNQLSSLTEYVGNGSDDRLIGVEEDGESVFTHGNEIDYNDIELLEDDPEYMECPDCGKKINVFGESKVDDTAKELGLNVLAKLPIMPEAARLADEGVFDTIDSKYIDEATDKIIG